MAAEIEQYKLLVRKCVDDIKKLDKLEVATFLPPIQKLDGLNTTLRMLPKGVCEDIADVMEQQGAAELLGQALTSLSDKDSPVPGGNFIFINLTVDVLLKYTDKSPALGRAVGQCGTVTYLLDILKHQPLWERSKDKPAVRKLLVNTVSLLGNISRLEQNRACFRQSNAVPVMQELLNNDLVEVRLAALQVIALVWDESDCDPFGETNVTKELLQVIGKPTVYGRYKNVGEIIYLSEELLEMLAMMSVCGPVRRKIYEAGAVNPLVQSIREGRAAEKRHAVTALHRLSRDPAVCSQMRREGQLHCPIWSTNPNQLRERATGSWASIVLCAFTGFISGCFSSRANEGQGRLAGVAKWKDGDVQAWMEESGLRNCGRNFAEMDGRTLHSFLEIRQQAPEFFAMVAWDVGSFHHLEDFLKFLHAVEKLD